MNQQQYRLLVDEVTDSVSWEQLGIIVVRYVKDNRPTERLLEYPKCPNIRGATIADVIIIAVNEVGIDIKKCRAQTYDGASNMAEKQQRAANQLKLKTGNENTTYFHSASRKLNLALSKSSKVVLTFFFFLLKYIKSYLAGGSVLKKCHFPQQVCFNENFL